MNANIISIPEMHFQSNVNFAEVVGKSRNANSSEKHRRPPVDQADHPAFHIRFPLPLQVQNSDPPWDLTILSVFLNVSKLLIDLSVEEIMSQEFGEGGRISCLN